MQNSLICEQKREQSKVSVWKYMSHTPPSPAFMEEDEWHISAVRILSLLPELNYIFIFSSHSIIDSHASPILLCVYWTLSTLQVLRSISLCLFSCSSDSFSFWTKLCMCSGKSSTAKYSSERTDEQIVNDVPAHGRQSCCLTDLQNNLKSVILINGLLTCIPWRIFQSVYQHVRICGAVAGERKRWISCMNRKCCSASGVQKGTSGSRDTDVPTVHNTACSVNVKLPSHHLQRAFQTLSFCVASSSWFPPPLATRKN